MGKLIVNCSNCNNKLEKSPRDKRNKNHFCNLKCKSEWQSKQRLSEKTKNKISIAVSGEKNGMFGKTHSLEIRSIISDLTKKRFLDDPDLRYRCGNSRLSKEERLQIIRKSHKKRTRESYIHHPSDETKKIIGKKSKEKFTPEYKWRVRKKLEDKGLILSLENKEDYIFYFEIAQWKEKIFNFITDPDQLSLLKERGVFNVKNNSAGVIRDHIYSRRSGFEEKVFPEILRHPANCQIITHANNISKKIKQYRDRDDITLNELFERIEGFNLDYIEHNRCLELIEKYKKGERYSKQNYIKDFYGKI